MCPSLLGVTVAKERVKEKEDEVKWEYMQNTHA